MCNHTRINEVTLDFSQPGKPTNNAFIESIQGKIRLCLAKQPSGYGSGDV